MIHAMPEPRLLALIFGIERNIELQPPMSPATTSSLPYNDWLWASQPRPLLLHMHLIKIKISLLPRAGQGISRSMLASCWDFLGDVEVEGRNPSPNSSSLESLA